MSEPRNREEWQALVMDLQKRVEALENKYKRRRGASVPTSELADLWIEVYKGRPPAYVFKQAQQVIRAYGWDRAKPVFDHYFRRTEVEFVNIPKCVMGAFERLEGEMLAGGRPGNGHGAARQGRPDPIDVAADGMALARRMRATQATGAQRGGVPGGDGEAGGSALSVTRQSDRQADRRP